MMYNVGVEVGKNEAGKGQFWFRRVHPTLLSEFLRKAQDNGGYIFAVTALYPLKKDKDESRLTQEMVDFAAEVDPIEDRAMIDPHGM